MSHRIFLDVSSMVYRAFFAMREPGSCARRTSGRPVHGYLDMVSRLLVLRRPDDVAHVYDHDWRPMARTQIYAATRPIARPNRTTSPHSSAAAEVFDFTGMTQAQAPDLEAEDAIGALCAGAGREDRSRS